MEKLDRKLIRRMILEEARVMKKQRVLAENNLKIARYCANKERRMLSEGYTQMEINESILGDLLGIGKDTVFGAPGGFLDSIEQMLIEKILKSLFGKYDPDSFVGAVITNVIENIDITEIGKYFGEGACDPIVDTLFKGVSEALTQQGLNKLFGERSDAGFLSSTMREAFANALNSTEFAESLKAGIKNTVCSFDFQSIYNSMASGLQSAMGGFKNYFAADNVV